MQRALATALRVVLVGGWVGMPAAAADNPHVGSLQLFEPPAGAGREVVRDTHQATLDAPKYRLYFVSVQAHFAACSLTSDGPSRTTSTWAATRRSALPASGRVRDLLELTSRLHSNLLDRHRPLWETHVIEGLRDGRLQSTSRCIKR